MPSIANDKRAIESEVEIFCGLPEQPGFRFAAVARLSVLLDDRLGMVRTIVEPVDARATGRQARRDVSMRFGDERFLENPAGDARLIGDNDDGKIRAVQQPDRIDAIGKEHETLQAIEVTGLFEQRAVAIKKHGGLRHYLVIRRAATASNTSSEVMR